jgi:hypothetical protein
MIPKRLHFPSAAVRRKEVVKPNVCGPITPKQPVTPRVVVRG